MTDETEHSGDPQQEDENKSGRRLTDAQWAEIVEAYELGTKNIVDLAKEYDVSRQNLSKRFKANGIQGGSRAHELKQAANEAAKSQAARAVRFADRRDEFIEETRMQGYAALKQAQMLAAKLVIDAHTSRLSMASIDDDMKALRRYQALLSDNIKTRLNDILGADKNTDLEDLPSLEVLDLTPEEVIEHHREIGALDDDTDIDELMKSVDQDLSDVAGEL